jgi:hypothetical protein
MRIDLEKVESQIRKLEELKRIASDPEMLSLLEGLIVQNGTSGNTRMPLFAPSAPIRESGQKGAVLDAVRQAALKQERAFSGYALARVMISEGYKFTAEKPGLAVTEALRRLIKKGVVTIYRSGRGSEPTLYERVLP